MVASAPIQTETRRTIGDDGTRIAYHVMGDDRGAPDERPVDVLANGLGGPHLAWKPLVEYFADRYRCITWDYRGLYHSDKPRTDRPGAYAIERHVGDLFAILASEGVERASLVGWSMGVQVCLEAYHRRGPALVTNLVLLNGTFGRPLDTVVPVPLGKHVVPSAVEIAGRLHVPAGKILRAVAKQPEAIRWLKRFGMMGETLDEEGFAHLVRAFGNLDVQAFFENLRALGEHDASRILPVIAAPVLVISGDRDRMTPRGLSQQMVRRIPRAESLVVRGGTHYTAIEFPELVNLRIEKFWREQGF
jgi:pimeloyl-ACP methyl ester carboxylesterase